VCVCVCVGVCGVCVCVCGVCVCVCVGHCLNGSPPAYTDMWPITAGQSSVDT